LLVEEATADLRGDQEGAGAEEELVEEDGEEDGEGVLFLLGGPFSCGAAIISLLWGSFHRIVGIALWDFGYSH